jgi:hypothetical protein
MKEMAKRVGPPSVPPVTLQGVRYEALHWGRERNLGQNGGFVRAVDPATGRELWTAQIYRIDYQPGMETDVQDRFIRTLAPTAEGRALLVTDERGLRFLLDLASREARPVETE